MRNIHCVGVETLVFCSSVVRRSHIHANLHHYGLKQTCPTHNRGWPHAKGICTRFEMLQQRVESLEAMINPNIEAVIGKCILDGWVGEESGEASTVQTGGRKKKRKRAE